LPGQPLKAVAGEIPHWCASPWLLEVDGEANRQAITPVLRGEKAVRRRPTPVGLVDEVRPAPGPPR
jgi:hypothetical protein